MRTHAAPRMASSNASGTWMTPILRLSDSTYTGRAGSKLCERREEPGIERFLRRLRIAGKVAQQRAAVTRELLQVQHLRTLVAQRGEQPALARTREAAHDDIAQSRRGAWPVTQRRAGARSDSRRRAAWPSSRFRSAHARATRCACRRASNTRRAPNRGALPRNASRGCVRYCARPARHPACARRTRTPASAACRQPCARRRSARAGSPRPAHDRCANSAGLRTSMRSG